MSENLTPTKKRKTKMLGKKELPTGKENILSELSMEQGVALFEQGDYIQAIEVFSFLTGNGDLLARQYLARCYYRLDKYDAAYKHFEYLSKYGDSVQCDYGTSMMAAIQILWRNFNDAIKMLKSLSDSPRNIMNLAIVYWKKYLIKKDEFSINEALRLLRRLDPDILNQDDRCRVYHTKALIYQAQFEYRLASDYYNLALREAPDSIRKGSVLNDYASLFLHWVKFDEAKQSLDFAKELLEGHNEIEMAYNHKWFGALALAEDNYPEAKKHLELAARTIVEKQLLQDLASTFYILADNLKQQNFYKAAECFADGLIYDRLSEEVNERNEKVISFIVDSFFGSSCNSSGVG